jgi:hypothetical protein
MDIYFINKETNLNPSYDDLGTAFNHWEGSYDFYNSILAIYIDNKIIYSIIGGWVYLYKTKQNETDLCCAIIYKPTHRSINIKE